MTSQRPARPELSRRHLLGASGTAVVAVSAAGCDALSTDPAGTEHHASSSRKGREAPSLATRVHEGKLPAVGKRLPDEPLVVRPTGQPGRYGGSLHNALLGRANSAYIWCLTGYENLVRWTARWTGAAGTGELTPNVARDYEVNADSTRFTFHLRPGMRWSDGKPFTADDVVFAVQDVLLNTDLFPATPAILSVDEGPATITKDDDHTFTITFPGPSGLFLQLLATPEGIPLLAYPRHYMKRFHIKFNPDVASLAKKEGMQGWTELFQAKAETYGENPDLPCLSAWKLVTPYGKGQRVICERNPYYWKVDPDGSQLPYLDRAVFDVVNTAQVMLLRALHGDINVEMGPDTRITSPGNKPVIARNRDEGHYRLVDAEATRMNVMVIAFNLTHLDPVKRQIFQAKDFRIGLSHAINRHEIIEATMQRQGEAYQVAPLPHSPFYDKSLATQYLEYDVDRANHHLDKAFPDRNGDGLRLGPDGEPIDFTLEFVANFRPEWSDMLDLVRRYWRKVGIQLRLRNEESSLATERKEANKHDASVWHGDGGLDVLLTTGYYFPSNFGSENFAPAWKKWYQSDGAEGEKPPVAPRKQMALYDRLKSTGDPAEQTRLMRSILRITREQFYIIGVVRENQKYFLAGDKLKNVPDSLIQCWYYPTPGPARTEQFFLAR